jgi:hypothetical protein
MKTHKRIFAVVATGIALLASGAASALTVDGAVFTSVASGSGTSWDVTVTMDFTNANDGVPVGETPSEYIGDSLEAWSLGMPGAGTVTLTAVSASAGAVADWTWNSEGKAGPNGCGDGNVNAICVDFDTLFALDGGGPVIDIGDIFSFTVHVDFLADEDWDGNGNFHLLTAIETDKGCGSGVDTCWKKDGDLISLPIGGGTSVPEPGTLALLGLGLLGLSMSRRRVSK